MSFAAIRWALAQDLPGVEKIVLVSLADFHNDKSGQCNPSKQTLADKAGICQRAADRILIRLCEKGLICVSQSSGWKPNNYSLNTPAQVQGNTPAQVQGSNSENPVPESEYPVPESEYHVPRTAKPIRTCNEHKEHPRKFSDIDFEIAEMIFQGVVRLNPRHKPPDMGKWADCVRLMRERDGRTPEDIREVFEWANQEDFWQSNILSPEKLRKQFDQLSIKMRPNGKRENGLPPKRPKVFMP